VTALNLAGLRLELAADTRPHDLAELADALLELVEHSASALEAASVAGYADRLSYALWLQVRMVRDLLAAERELRRAAA
jgi:hypothetical protein